MKPAELRAVRVEKEEGACWCAAVAAAAAALEAVQTGIPGHDREMYRALWHPTISLFCMKS